MPPLVSILIPAYNAEQWISDTVQSALRQTWPNTEIIIVDDGSSDRTLSVARRFISGTVSVVTQENQGASAARNRAFALCQGDYIQWLDADDLLSPDKIARQMEAWSQCPAKNTLLSCPWGYFMYRPDRARFQATPLWADLSPLEWLVRKWETNAHMNPATWLVTRELTQAAGPWDTRLTCCEDGEYFCRVILASDGIRFVPGAKVFYRSATTSASYIGRSSKKMASQFLGMKLQISHLRAREDSARVCAACVTCLRSWLHTFYPNRPDLVQEAQHLAASLGGWLFLPKASWKYAWIENVFGFAAAKHTQFHCNRVKSSVLRAWDKIMYSFERNGSLRT